MFVWTRRSGGRRRHVPRGRCREDGEEQEDADEEEFECVFGGKSNEILSKIIPNLEKKSNVDVSSQISARRGGRNAELAEEEKSTKKEAEVRVVSTVKGGIEPCYVCGKVFAIMPNNCKLCYSHKRVMDKMVKKWTPKRAKGKKKKGGVMKKEKKKKVPNGLCHSEFRTYQFKLEFRSCQLFCCHDIKVFSTMNRIHTIAGQSRRRRIFLWRQLNHASREPIQEGIEHLPEVFERENIAAK